MATSARTALILGATGLVGKNCLHQLLTSNRYTKIIALVRKPTAVKDDRLVEHIADFERLAEQASHIVADDIFCALGTTSSQAKSKAALRRVDFDYPLQTAQIAAVNGAAQFILVSAIGAAPKSSVFYLRVKGELEQELGKLPYRSLHFLRPAWLVGERAEPRWREKLGISVARLLTPFMIGPLRAYRSIEAAAVAKAMLIAAAAEVSGVHVYTSDRIQRVAAAGAIVP